MRQYNIVFRILPILTVIIITFALAAPVLVQEECQTCVDVVHVPGNAITVLGKRTREQDLDMLWDGLRYYEHVWGNRNPPGVHLQEPAPHQAEVPPPNPAEGHVQPQNPAEVQAPVVHVPQNPVEPDRESIDLDDGTQPPVSESEHSDYSDSPPSPVSSTGPGDFHTAPSSPVSSTGPGDFHTAQSSLGSPTESDSELDSGSEDRWSTISNAASEESQSENLEAADSELTQSKGKATVSRRTSGTVSGFERVEECG